MMSIFNPLNEPSTNTGGIGQRILRHTFAEAGGLYDRAKTFT